MCGIAVNNICGLFNYNNRCTFRAMALGQRTKAERDAQGLTQEELAEKAGIKQQTLQALEKRNSRRSEHAAALAVALGVNLEWLIDGKGKKRGGSHAIAEPPPKRYGETTKKLVGLIETLSLPQQKALITLLEPQITPKVQDPGLIPIRKVGAKKRKSST
ncbi:MAG: helix-turn-helix transcriptional regulator [Candidatus Thiodiazotropha sp. (ex Monitilora ramsayi)]|nr:helix-turn-helix transcriptional regulator [Candidatus Thiodiazotropha sp. (ex Monitilora ramsayi)]